MENIKEVEKTYRISGERIKMTGIILLLILTCWLYIVTRLSNFFTGNIPVGKRRVFIKTFLFILIFFMPVADEVIGGFQFWALCRPANMVIYDENKIKGKTVQYMQNMALGRLVINKFISIRENKSVLVDPNNGETLIIYNTYYAKGGKLSRFIGFPPGNSPFIFPNHCSSKEFYELFKKFNINKIEGYYGE